jgi:hypothetical protein
MSTRGWYDYHVIDTRSGSLSLAMRFYKWGDATPENALSEYLNFRDILDQHNKRLPIEWLDTLLRDQLGALHTHLPAHFAPAAFLFLLQRAWEENERDHWNRFGPPEERADFPLRFALEEAQAAKPFEIAPSEDPTLERVRRFIATAHYLRPWRDYGLRLDVLRWLQYVTQSDTREDMGSLAGDWKQSWDIAYQYRLFIWLDSGDPFKIDQIAIELCERDGQDVLTTADTTDDPEELAPEERDPEERQWHQQQIAKLQETIRQHDIRIASLDMLQHEYATTPDHFWTFREQPEPEETRRRARIKALQGSCNMLLRLIKTRFGAAIAEQSRPLMESIDDFDRLLELSDFVFNSPDHETWLKDLHQFVKRESPPD